MEKNIKPDPRLIELLCSIRSTQFIIQTFIDDNQAEFINSTFSDLADYLNPVQDYLCNVSCEISDNIGGMIISDIDNLLEESRNNTTESKDVKMKLSSIEMRKSKKTA